MLFASVVNASAAVTATSARSRKIEVFADTLRAAPPAEVGIVVAYLAGSLPQGKLGLGYATLRDARTQQAAAAPTLSVTQVDAACEALAKARGRGAHAQRARILRELLERLTDVEQDFFFRLALGELRQGALDAVVAEAVAKAAGVPAETLRRAAMLAGTLPTAAAAALAGGAPALAEFRLQVLQPVQPMLAQTAGGLASVLAHLGEVALEWKLDGARIQVHKDADAVRVFSRQLNDVTAAVPEIVDAIRALPARQLVLDGEALALHADRRPRAFQDTMRRFGRRIDVEAMRQELPLACFFFDLLHVDGEDWLTRSFAERCTKLAALVPGALLVPRLHTRDLAAAEAFVQQALAAGHEGVMLKDLSAPYDAGRRGAAWQKLKPAHTLDLVVLAAEWGNGRRQGLLSNLHLAARDATGAFVMLGKTFKGMTDAMLAEQTQALLAREVRRDAQVVHVRPELVVEVACDGVQRSSRYPGGVALRFARIVRYRPDKTAADIDTIEAVRALLPAHSGGEVLEGADDGHEQE